LLRASNQLPEGLPTYAALRSSRMSTLLICSTVLRPYPRDRGNVQRLLAEVEIDRFF
jgi:hypothetical protein